MDDCTNELHNHIQQIVVELDNVASYPLIPEANVFWIYHIKSAIFMQPSQLKVVIFKHLQ